MDDPDWMNDFKSPSEGVLLLSSSPSSSSRDETLKKDHIYISDEDISKTNGKEDSDEDSVLVTPVSSGRESKSGVKGRKTSLEGSPLKKPPPTNKRKSAAKAEDVVLSVVDHGAGEEVKVSSAGRSKGLKRSLDSDEDDEYEPPSKSRKTKPSPKVKRENADGKAHSDEDDEYEPPSKSRKTKPSPKVKRENADGKALNSGRRAKRVSFSQGEDASALKRVKRDFASDIDDEEAKPLSSLVKKDKTLPGVATASCEEGLDEFNLIANADRSKDASTGVAPPIKEDIDALPTNEEAVSQEDAGEGSERKAKPRVSSSLPVVFADNLQVSESSGSQKTKVLLECEGDALDLSGDMGAVGRFSVSSEQEKGKDELLFDLKGIVYKTTIVPSNTFFVVNVLQTEAKVEAIMSDFMQLLPDINQVKDETLVEGTMEDFAFDLDNDGEPLSTPATAGVDSDADEDTKQKKNLAKLQKVKKTSATKGGKGSRAKGGGKGNATSRKPRAKLKGGASKKPSKTKLTGGQRVKKI